MKRMSNKSTSIDCKVRVFRNDDFGCLGGKVRTSTLRGWIAQGGTTIQPSARPNSIGRTCQTFDYETRMHGDAIEMSLGFSAVSGRKLGGKKPPS